MISLSPLQLIVPTFLVSFAHCEAGEAVPFGLPEAQSLKQIGRREGDTLPMETGVSECRYV